MNTALGGIGGATAGALRKVAGRRLENIAGTGFGVRFSSAGGTWDGHNDQEQESLRFAQSPNADICVQEPICPGTTSLPLP